MVHMGHAYVGHVPNVIFLEVRVFGKDVCDKYNANKSKENRIWCHYICGSDMEILNVEFEFSRYYIPGKKDYAFNGKSDGYLVFGKGEKPTIDTFTKDLFAKVHFESDGTIDTETDETDEKTTGADNKINSPSSPSRRSSRKSKPREMNVIFGAETRETSETDCDDKEVLFNRYLFAEYGKIILELKADNKKVRKESGRKRSRSEFLSDDVDDVCNVSTKALLSDNIWQGIGSLLTGSMLARHASPMMTVLTTMSDRERCVVIFNSKIEGKKETPMRVVVDSDQLRTCITSFITNGSLPELIDLVPSSEAVSKLDAPWWPPMVKHQHQGIASNELQDWKIDLLQLKIQPLRRDIVREYVEKARQRIRNG